MVDHVHPTAFGQVAIAERALDVLARDGMAVKVRAGDADRPERRAPAACAVIWTYAYRHSQGVDAGGAGVTPSCSKPARHVAIA